MRLNRKGRTSIVDDHEEDEIKEVELPWFSYGDPELSALIDEYNIIFINGKRYYEFDMTTKLPILDNVIPYKFKYRDIEIYESAWNKMALRIVEELDKIHHRNNDYLLSLEYWWSKTEVFSKVPKRNFTPYKDLFLNTNHTATHSMMSIQCLLEAFGVSLSDCYFVLRKHPSAEPYSVRTYFKNKNIEGFKKCMVFRGFPAKKIESTINNFNVINKLLNMVSQGYDDFFLFDDYYYFLNYKIKTIQKANEKFVSQPQNIPIVERTLNRLDEYFRNKSFYDYICNVEINPELRTALRTEIEYLFSNLNTSVITSSKLYARMSICHEDILRSLGEFNTQAGIFRFATAYFEKSYFFKKPFISREREMNLDNDDIIISYAYEQDEITINKLNAYANKMHLKKLNNYMQFMIESADEYVQIDQDKMIKKELFDLDDKLVGKIEKELSYYIKSFGNINSETYNGYDSLPKITYKWNKYLLLGVVRTLLIGAFKIVYKPGTYKTFEFEISLL